MNATPEQIMLQLYPTGIHADTMAAAMAQFRRLMDLELGINQPDALPTVAELAMTTGNGHALNRTFGLKRKTTATKAKSIPASRFPEAMAQRRLACETALKIGGTLQELVLQSGVSKPTVYDVMNKLKKKGYRVVKGSNPAGVTVYKLESDA